MKYEKLLRNKDIPLNDIICKIKMPPFYINIKVFILRMDPKISIGKKILAVLFI